MKRSIILINVFLGALSFSSSSFAFKNRVYSLGIAYFSENIFNMTAGSPDGSTQIFGEGSLPVILKYDYGFASNWFFSPQFSYGLFPRTSPGDTAQVTISHLAFLFGKNFSFSGAGSLDWYFGPGYLQRDIKGAGGAVVMNNGTSTATFARPGNTSTTKKMTMMMGGSYLIDNSRIGFDLIFENLFSQTKRAQSFMLSFAYQFGGF